MTHDDITPLSDRLAVLQATRLLAVVAVLGAPSIFGHRAPDLTYLAIGYVGITAAAEAMRRLARVRVPLLVAGMLLLDGVFLAYAMTITGGTRSPLLFLMFLDVLAATLLASYRSGLKIAVWNALLLFLGQAAVRAGAIDATAPSTDHESAMGAAAFLVVAICAALFSAVNDRALRHSRTEMAHLVELDHDLHLASTASDIARVLARHLHDRLGFGRVVVVTRQGGAGQYVLVDADGDATTGTCARPSDEDLLRACAGSETRLARALAPDEWLDVLLPEARNVVVVGLSRGSDRYGIVAGEWGPDRARIRASLVARLAQACTHAAGALDNRALLRRVQRLAAGDPLTGLANRRVFEATLRRERERSARTGESLTLVMLDVDHFKQINDTRGHPAGDAVLRAIAGALTENTKGFDLPARLGGDEFAIILPGCTAREAERAAERLRRAAAATIPPDSDGDVSAGTATIPDDASTVEALVAAADAALYESKRAGRGRSRRAGASTAG